MATRLIKTRIQNKIDTFENWTSLNPMLLSGEIATAHVEAAILDKNTGSYLEPGYYFKVGDGSNLFNSLPWTKAADVYPWAKNENAEDVNITIIDGTDEITKTLKEWFEHVAEAQAIQDAAIALNTEKLAGHTDAAINALINSKVSTLVSTTNGTGIVKDVVQTDGKVTVTKGALTANEVPELPANKIVVTADNTATTDVNEKVTLDAKLISIAKDITAINTAIAGGVHFVGVVIDPADLINSLSTQEVTLDDDKKYTANAGDVVIQGEKEFIWTGAIWKELGDLTRVGELEQWKEHGLDVPDNKVYQKFVTAVSQTDGKISVSREQPTINDIAYATKITLGDELASRKEAFDVLSAKVDVAKISTAISDSINALSVTDPTASGSSATFISTLKQENGKIVATKAAVASASTSTAGIAKLNDNTNSTSTTEAATANAVKKTYDVAVDAQDRVNAVEGNYIKFNSTDSKMYVGKSGVDEVIFDCGGVPAN